MSVNQLIFSLESGEIFFFPNMNKNYFNSYINYEENLIDLNSNNSYLSNNNNNINILSLSSIEENNLLSLSEEKYTNNVEEKKLYLYLMKNIIVKKVQMIIGKDLIIFIKEKK